MRQDPEMESHNDHSSYFQDSILQNPIAKSNSPIYVLRVVVDCIRPVEYESEVQEDPDRTGKAVRTWQFSGFQFLFRGYRRR